MSGENQHTTAADRALCAGDHARITGNALVDILHRHVVSDIVKMYDARHPNGPPLKPSQLSTRLQTAKANIRKAGGRTEWQTTDDIREAQRACGLKVNPGSGGSASKGRKRKAAEREEEEEEEEDELVVGDEGESDPATDDGAGEGISASPLGSDDSRLADSVQSEQRVSTIPKRSKAKMKVPARGPVVGNISSSRLPAVSQFVLVTQQKRRPGRMTAMLEVKIIDPSGEQMSRTCKLKDCENGLLPHEYDAGVCDSCRREEDKEPKTPELGDRARRNLDLQYNSRNIDPEDLYKDEL